MFAEMQSSANQIATRSVEVQRVTYISRRPLEDVLATLDGKIGHPDMRMFSKDLAAKSTEEELEKVVHSAVGPADLMEFSRMDLGAVLKKELGPEAPQSIRLLVGNPLIMKQMVKRVPDAGSYAPATILVDERAA